MPTKRSTSAGRKGKAKTPAPGLKFIKAPTFLTTYANNANVTISNWDFRIVFGEVAGKEPDGALIVEQRVSIVMSPQHVKAFADILQGLIAKYEEQFGEIRWQVSPGKHADKNVPT